jgi:hypothetical protein
MRPILSRPVVILFFITCFILLYNPAWAGYSAQDDYYLWLEYDIKKGPPDSPFFKLLYIYYGKRPGDKNNLQLLNKLEAFYTFGAKDASGRDIYYKLNIIKIGDRYAVQVQSSERRWCQVVVKAAKSADNGRVYDYTAKTSFFILGHLEQAYLDKLQYGKEVHPLPIWMTMPLKVTLADAKKRILTSWRSIWRKDGIYVIKDKELGPAASLDPKLDIVLDRERIDEPDNLDHLIYFSPLRFIVSFNGKPLGLRNATVISEEGLEKQMGTDKSGEFLYVAGKQKVNRDFQELFLTENVLGAIIYRNVYTVPFKDYDLFYDEYAQFPAFELRGGFGIFLAAFVLALLASLLLRGKFRT